MSCHAIPAGAALTSDGSVAMVGQPNVGKSALFQRLTGQYVTVSNYPGTTVEIMRGRARDLPNLTLVDTPGIVTFPPQSEDEIATERVLLDESLRAILQVGDAKNIRRTLLLTVQLAEMGLPMVLALNMMDEALDRGVRLDLAGLSARLALPVVPTSAVRGQGIQELTEALLSTQPPRLHISYHTDIEQAVAAICDGLSATPISPRSLALLFLSRDTVAESWLHQHLPDHTYRALCSRRRQLEQTLTEPVAASIQKTRLAFVQQLVDNVLLQPGTEATGIGQRLGLLATRPLTGTLILLGVLAALYWFVGLFGAGTLVDLLENWLFGTIINPRLSAWVYQLSPFPFLSDFLVGEYGLWTMGMTYALALILPIVTTFFLAFGIMEDSGYLPRLAVLSNRLFRALGLNGKAVLPMVLGLGCVTMATLTTRVLENRRDRLLVTLLLALAIPCSAQLGVVMGMLAGISFTATLMWAGVVFLILLFVGRLAARLLPGQRTPLLVELPPLRPPLPGNVLLKTLARLEWYLKEVVPLFLLGTALLFILDKTGLLQTIIEAGRPLVSGWLGLPPETSAAFLMGFLRRDFGAAGLFLLASQGLLKPAQTVVAIVTITLFIPCIASVMMIVKERGWRSAAGIVAIVFPLAFLVGGLLNRILLTIGWGV
ncbi:MAG: ferrous iron transport protein B [Caldilineae bacterium]|nr:MAG: ferrous iron transport protein B [Caldilineae bacterium]